MGGVAVALAPARERGRRVSLLQDALRKAQRLGGSSTPPPLPPLRGGSPGKPGTRWKVIAGILAAAFAVGIAGVLFLTRRTSPPPVLPPVPAASPAIPSPAPPVAPPPSPVATAPPGASPAVPPTPAISEPASTRPTAKAGASRVRGARRQAVQRASAPSVPVAASGAAAAPSNTDATPAPVAASAKDPVLEKFNA
ncbi:MAG: hypothetical protein B7Z62_05040, partial [Deltaproteobacteria bacterium 37-65-8]